MIGILTLFVLFLQFGNAQIITEEEQFAEELRQQLNITPKFVQRKLFGGNEITFIVVIVCVICLLVTCILLNCYFNGVRADPVLNFVYTYFIVIYDEIRNKTIVIITPIYYWIRNLSVRTMREVLFSLYTLIRMVVVFLLYLLLFSALMLLTVVISHYVYQYQPIQIKDHKLKNCTTSPNLSYCTYVDKKFNYMNVLYTDNFTLSSLSKQRELLFIDNSFYLQYKEYDNYFCQQIADRCKGMINPEDYIMTMNVSDKEKYDRCPFTVHQKCYTTTGLMDNERNKLIINYELFDDKYREYLLPYTIMEYVQHFVLLLMFAVYVIIDRFDKIKIFTATFLKHYMKKNITKNKMKFIIDEKIKIFFKILFVVNMVITLIPILMYIYYCYTVFAILMSLVYIFYVIYSTYNLNSIDYYIDLHKEKFSQLYVLNGGLNKLFNRYNKKTHVVKELVLKNKTTIQSMYQTILKNDNQLHLTQKQIIDFIVYYGENYAYEFKRLIQMENVIVPRRLELNVQPTISNFVNYVGQLDDDYLTYKQLCNLYDIKNKFTTNYYYSLLISYIRLVMDVPTHVLDEVTFKVSNKLKPFLTHFQQVDANYYKIFDFVTKQIKRVALFKQNDIVMHLVHNGNANYTISIFNVESTNSFYDTVFSRTVETVNVDEENEKVVTNVYKDKVNPIQLKKIQRVEEHSGSHALSRIEHFTIRRYGTEGSRKRVLDVGSNFCGTVLSKGIVYNIANVERKDDARLLGYSERLYRYLLINTNDSVSVYFGDVTEMDFHNCDIETAYLHNCIYNIDLTNYATTHIISNFKNTITNTQIPSLLLTGMDTYDIDNEMTWTLKKQISYNFSNCSRSKYTVCGHTENEFYEHNVSTLFDWFHIAVLNVKKDNELVGFKSNVVRKMCGYYTMQWTVSAPESDTVEQVVSNVNYKPCVLIDDGISTPREIIFFSRDTASCSHNITDSFLFNNKTSYLNNEKMLNDMCFQNVDSYKKIQNCKYKTMAKVVSEHYTKKTKMVIQMDNIKNKDKMVFNSTGSVRTHVTPTIVIGTGDKPIHHQLENLFGLFADIDSKTYIDDLFNKGDAIFEVLEKDYGKIVIKIQSTVINYIIDKEGMNNNILYFNYKDSDVKQEFNVSNRESLFIKIWFILQNTQSVDVKQNMQEIMVGKILKTQKMADESNIKDVYYRDEVGNIVGPYDNNTNSVIQTHETAVELTNSRNAENVEGQEDIMETKKETIVGRSSDDSKMKQRQRHIDTHESKEKVIQLEGDVQNNVNDIVVSNDETDSNSNSGISDDAEQQNVEQQAAGPQQQVVDGDVIEQGIADQGEFNMTRKKVQNQKGKKEIDTQKISKNKTAKTSTMKNRKNNDNYFFKNQLQGKEALANKINNYHKTQQLLRKPMVVSEISEHKKQFNIDDLPFKDMTASEVLQAEKTGEWVQRNYRTIALLDMNDLTVACRGVRYDNNLGRLVNTTTIRMYKNKTDYDLGNVTEVLPGNVNQSVLKTLCLVKIADVVYKTDCQSFIRLLNRNNYRRVNYNFGQLD